MPTRMVNALEVSVIIPTFNAGLSFRSMLEKLINQTVPPKDIIVIDSSSNDGTAETAAIFGAKVVSIEQEEFDHGWARNLAASHATGEVFVFLTQDAMPENENLLAELISPFSDPKVAYVYGRQLPRPNSSTLERLARNYNYPEEPAVKSSDDIPKLGIKTFFCSNVCSAIRSGIFYELGEFPSPVIFNEDLFMSAKCIVAGYRVVYEPKAQVVHSHDYSFIQQFRRFFDNGVSMSMNAWIMEYSSVGKAGTHMVRILIRKLVLMNKRRVIPVLLLESIVKFAGYQLGKRYKIFPKRVCLQLTMHRKIWTKFQPSQSGGKTIEGNNFGRRDRVTSVSIDESNE